MLHDMSWQQIFLIVYFAVNTATVPFWVGRKRETLTPGAGLIAAALYLLLLWLAVSI